MPIEIKPQNHKKFRLASFRASKCRFDMKMIKQFFICLFGIVDTTNVTETIRQSHNFPGGGGIAGSESGASTSGTCWNVGNNDP